MKYKVLKGTKLFDSLLALKEKCDECNSAALNLAKKNGAEKAATTGGYVAGSIDAFLFNSPPEKELWMQPDRYRNPNLFYPRSGKSKKVKPNDSLHEKIKSLPVVTYENFNNVIGFRSQFVTFGDGFFHFEKYGLSVYSEIALIEIDSRCEYTPLPEMIDITDSEFNQIKLKNLMMANNNPHNIQVGQVLYKDNLDEVIIEKIGNKYAYTGGRRPIKIELDSLIVVTEMRTYKLFIDRDLLLKEKILSSLHDKIRNHFSKCWKPINTIEELTSIANILKIGIPNYEQ